jgi:hypothetical protein
MIFSALMRKILVIANAKMKDFIILKLLNIVDDMAKL